MELDEVQKCFITGNSNAGCCEKTADCTLYPVKYMWGRYDDNGERTKNLNDFCFSNTISPECPHAGGGYGVGGIINITLGPLYILTCISLAPLLLLGGPLKACVLCCDDDAKKHNIVSQKKISDVNTTALGIELQQKRIELNKIIVDIERNKQLLENQKTYLTLKSTKTADFELFIKTAPRSVTNETTQLLNNFRGSETETKKNVEKYNENIATMESNKKNLEKEINDITKTIDSITD